MRGGFTFLQSLVLWCEAPAEPFPVGFLGAQDPMVTHLLLMSSCHLCEATAVSDTREVQQQREAVVVLPVPHGSSKGP